MKKYFQQIWATPFVHGAYVAVSGAVIGAISSEVMACITSIQTSGKLSVPDWKTMVTYIIVTGVGALGAYLHKNGIKGGSGIPSASN